MRVRITKLNPSTAPKYPTSKKDEYICGKDNGPVSPFVGYEVVGSVYGKIQEGEPITVFREERNGIKVGGVFRTSIVQKIDGEIVETDNSFYRVEKLLGKSDK